MIPIVPLLRSARMVLQNPRVDLAVMEVARGGILREGSPMWHLDALDGTLNFTLQQKLGEYFRLFFQAKNLLNPEIQTVYRSEYLPDGDIVTEPTPVVAPCVNVPSPVTPAPKVVTTGNCRVKMSCVEYDTLALNW